MRSCGSAHHALFSPSEALSPPVPLLVSSLGFSRSSSGLGALLVSLESSLLVSTCPAKREAGAMQFHFQTYKPASLRFTMFATPSMRTLGFRNLRHAFGKKAYIAIERSTSLGKKLPLITSNNARPHALRGIAFSLPLPSSGFWPSSLRTGDWSVFLRSSLSVSFDPAEEQA